MQLLRSVLYLMVFYSATALLVIAGILATLLGREYVRAVVHSWADLHHKLADSLLGIRVEVEGKLPPSAVLIAVKHQSMYETLEIVRLADTPVVVLKRELSDIPLFGWLTRRYGVIPVDRQAGSKALREMVAHGRDAIAAGRPVVIFPEGTRVRPGEHPPLRSGFAGLYRALGLPVVPVAVDSGRLWPKGVVKRPGVIHFRIGKMIQPGLKRAEIEEQVHAAINALED